MHDNDRLVGLRCEQRQHFLETGTKSFRKIVWRRRHLDTDDALLGAPADIAPGGEVGKRAANIHSDSQHAFLCLLCLCY